MCWFICGTLVWLLLEIYCNGLKRPRNGDIVRESDCNGIMIADDLCEFDLPHYAFTWIKHEEKREEVWSNHMTQASITTKQPTKNKAKTQRRNQNVQIHNNYGSSWTIGWYYHGHPTGVVNRLMDKTFLIPQHLYNQKDTINLCKDQGPTTTSNIMVIKIYCTSI